MNINHLLAAAGILVPCATAFLVAYWHRKQMRQVEAFRVDPSVGVRPPPSLLWTFLMRYRVLLVGVGVPSLFLALQLRSEGPVTVLTVVNISAAIASILFALVMEAIGRVIQMLKGIVSILNDVSGLMGRQIDVVEKMARFVPKNKKGPSRSGGA